MTSIIATQELLAICGMDTELNKLGYSEPGQWAIKWLIKNILITSFLVCRFPLQRFIMLEPLLKWTLVGMALNIAWLPCLKAYPVVSVMLMCLNTFLFAIGPFTSIPILLGRLFELNQHVADLLFGPSLFLITFNFYNNLCNLMGHKIIYSFHELRCFYTVLIYAWIVYKDTLRGIDRRQAEGAQEIALEAIRHIN